MIYCKNYCEEKEISTSKLNKAQRTLYYIAENMKMEKSISEEGYKHFQMAIKALKQEPKTGHWIYKTRQSACGVAFYRFDCSECGEPSGLKKSYARYCPWCGTKMVESEE